MNIRFLLLLLVPLWHAAPAVDAVAPTYHQVCVWGAGAGGSWTAVLAKDAGLDVTLIDRQGTIGGHCDTQKDPDNPDVWNEAGVVIYPNTTLADSLGLGPWGFDLFGMFERFNATMIPQFFEGMPTFLEDVDKSLFLGPAPIPPLTPEQIDALNRLVLMMNTTLRFMDTLAPGNVPNPLPFSVTGKTVAQWIADNNFTSIGALFVGPLFSGGFGNLTSLNAFDGLMQRTITDLLYNTLPGAWKSVLNGCQTIYDGIADYLGPDTLFLNATVTNIDRPLVPIRSGRLVKITGTRNGVPFDKRCRVLVTAVPQTIEKLEPVMDLSVLERLLFDSVTTRALYVGRVDTVLGSLGAFSQNFTLANVNISAPDGLPNLPALLQLIRKFDEGPTVHQSFFTNPTPQAEAAAFIKASLDKIVASGALTNHSNFVTWLHEYNPHWSPQVLQSLIAPHNLFDGIQGLRRTWNVGALRTTANTMTIIKIAIEVMAKIIEFLDDDDSRRRDAPIAMRSYGGEKGAYDPNAARAYLESLSSPEVAAMLHAHARMVGRSLDGNAARAAPVLARS